MTAQVWRSRLGGAIPDAWALAAIALIGLTDLLPRMPVFWQHACDIVAALRDVPGVRAVPDPPQTPLFHVHVPAGPDALAQAARQMIRDHRVHLLLRARSAPRPDASFFEVCVDENAMQVSSPEAATFIDALVSHARQLDA